MASTSCSCQQTLTGPRCLPQPRTPVTKVPSAGAGQLALQVVTQSSAALAGCRNLALNLFLWLLNQ